MTLCRNSPRPYEIVVAIGVSGMGEVYRAKDTKLDRGRSRLKYYRPHWLSARSDSHDSSVKRRFFALLEESNGVRALVMESVPGRGMVEYVPI